MKVPPPPPCAVLSSRLYLDTPRAVLVIVHDKNQNRKSKQVDGIPCQDGGCNLTTTSPGKVSAPTFLSSNNAYLKKT
ncbi:hypothetical protein JTE90_000312 [Oedothorax gibbosus]|uniref:Uncharacterized protein n=1 Tax=Oedothorax gibbosus TaxID=931172 RepID=A0AAV6VTK5_9ARAC|nr:hypothetical protein JTE90_000312 [Oedothorax gibbosus]